MLIQRWESKRITARNATRSLTNAIGVFLSSIYMFTFNLAGILAILCAVPVSFASNAHADVFYEANRGDCLSGIVKAHYPDTTGHYFVLHANPDIEDANQIEVGQKIRLPGLDPHSLLSEIDQTECNAAANARRAAARDKVVAKALAVVDKRQPKAPSKESLVATATDVVVATTIDEVKAPLSDAAPTAATPPTVVAAARGVATAAPVKPAKNRIDRQEAGPHQVVAGTVPVPIDVTQRTEAMKAQGRPTRAVAPMPSAPIFAVDERSQIQAYANRQSTPNRYVVNAIGARTNTAATALVQHPDQNFYVEGRADWKDALNSDALPCDHLGAVPVNEPSARITTPLEDALAEQTESKTQRAGNIFIDESLLRKAATQSGGNP